MNLSTRPLHTLDLEPPKLFGAGNLLMVHEKGEKQEPPIDGSFILQLLISEFVSKSTQPGSAPGSSKVLLVLTHQTEKHWNQCCAKFGQNLETLKSSRSLVVIDTLKLQYDELIGRRINETAAEDLPKKDDNLTELLKLCTSSIDALYAPGPQQLREPRQSLLIIIENLTSLFLDQDEVSCGGSGHIINTIEFLRHLRTYRQNELDTSVATLVKSNIHDSSWTSSNSYQKSANYMANLLTECFDGTVFEISPLSTGYSEEIHGRVHLKPCNKSYHFKIEDRNVKFISTV